jgi:RES domain-containing protein
MEAFRIARKNYVNDLSGTGAKLFGGRWNEINSPMLYLATSRALATAEILVHIIVRPLQEEYALLALDIIGKDVNYTEINLYSLKPDWKNDIAYTQYIGKKFLEDGTLLYMKVPSAVVEGEHNILINPALITPKNVVIKSCKSFEFDARFFKTYK